MRHPLGDLATTTKSTALRRRCMLYYVPLNRCPLPRSARKYFLMRTDVEVQIATHQPTRAEYDMPRLALLCSAALSLLAVSAAAVSVRGAPHTPSGGAVSDESGDSGAVLHRRAPAQVFRKCTVNNTVALTFDDGPFFYLNDMVRLMNQEKVKGTFFMNGNNWACIYNPGLSDAVKFAYDSGHQLASHTWSHKRMTNLTWDQIHDEMWRTELAISRITGASPAFMRPAYGEYNDLVLEASGVRGQSIVLWDFDSEDGLAQPISRQKQLYDTVAAARPDTILSIQHEVHDTIKEMLPYAIQKLKAAGYNFVTVAECLGMRPYTRVVAPGIRDPATWQC